ncbi:MAG TPA: PqiC family protein [Candidatus Binataceae bacterium]|nr:PqiC family protein [Candidatus Binataceae bacterium]
MKHNRYFPDLAAVWILAAVLAGCSTLLAPIPDKSRFFMLTPITPGESGSPAAQSAPSSLILGLGPIKFPAYLDRTEVVTQVEPNRMEVSETNHWAEPLKNNFTTVLGENLSTLLGTPQIVHFPWYSTTHMDYQLATEVQRFDSDAQGNARLIAQWTIEDPTTKKILDRGESNLTASGASDAEQSALQLSRVLADFSRQLATAIGQVNAQRRMR